ncbi:MAG TPA: hypothetical protein ENN17_05735 [bacterium]|nr:hypothetical protein [bacterium]
MKEEKRSIIPGVLLVLAGLWLLSRDVIQQHGIWERIYPLVILVFAGFYLIDWVRRKKEDTFFWAVFFLLTGLFYLLRNYDLIPYLYIEEYWPVFFLFWGLGYLVRFFLRPAEWNILIPAILFLFMGAFFFLHAAGGVLDFPDIEIEKYWPAGLIVIGCGLLISALFKSLKNNSDQGQIRS